MFNASSIEALHDESNELEDAWELTCSGIAQDLSVWLLTLVAFTQAFVICSANAKGWKPETKYCCQASYGNT